jgi:hypothetical protein
MDVLGKFGDASFVCTRVEIAGEDVRKKNGAAIMSVTVNQEDGLGRAERVLPAAVSDAGICEDRYGILPHQLLNGQIPYPRTAAIA